MSHCPGCIEDHLPNEEEDWSCPYTSGDCESKREKFEDKLAELRERIAELEKTIGEHKCH